MVVQRKNLLEAFRHAGNTPSQEPEPSAGPFATSAPKLARPKKDKAFAAAAVPIWVPWAFGVALAFVFGVAIGRSTVRVEAGETAGEVSDTPAEVRYEGSSRFDPPAQASAREDQAETSVPLLDTQNRYTIIVATYGSSRKDFAMQTMQSLYDQGFDVMPLAELNDNFIVLVGAAPEVDDLRATRDRLARLASWDGTPEAYADAYVEKIDRLIDR